MDKGQHIAPAFDRDLDAIEAQIARMGGLVEAALVEAVRALETRDTELAEVVRRGDAAIDALEEEIDAAAALLLARRAPAAADLRTVLATMKIAAALERCGDYAKNLASRSTVLARMPAIEGASGSIRRMGDAVRMQLRNALDAWLRRDAALAERVRQGDHDIDQMYNTLFREFLTYMMEDPRHISACMHLHFIAKNIERAGDHTTSIAEQTIYLVTGTLPDDERPKADNATGTQRREGLWQSP